MSVELHWVCNKCGVMNEANIKLKVVSSVLRATIICRLCTREEMIWLSLGTSPLHATHEIVWEGSLDSAVREGG